jgi:phenylacetate-CoA ligase
VSHFRRKFDAAAPKLEHDIRSYVGVSSPVRLALPGGIERPNGKAKRTLDRRPK